jgi:cephalosporin hydroxylase
LVGEPNGDEALAAFHNRWYEIQGEVSWLGIPTLKCPLDLWIYQEILFEKRPDLIIETGTAMGGTTAYLAAMCDLIDSGRIVTIDWRERDGRPPHPRITYVQGNAIGPRALEQVRQAVRPEDSVMVILDSGHRCEFVLEELRRYAPLVSPGQYLIVEDTNVNGHPVRPDFGPGPMEAVQEFLRDDELGREFVPDRSREKFLLTFNPSGFLLRQAR